MGRNGRAEIRRNIKRKRERERGREAAGRGIASISDGIHTIENVNDDGRWVDIVRYA